MNIKPTQTTGEVAIKLGRGEENLLADASAAAPAPSSFRLKRILVPIDFSDCALKALRYAVPFAKQNGASITLLHIVNVPSYYAVDGGGFNYGAFQPDYATLEADLRALGEKRLTAMAQEEARDHVPTDSLVTSGPPASEIVETARSMPADLIVISTHGRTGLNHVLLGSVAEHVIRHAPCPVLVVREHEHEFVGD